MLHLKVITPKKLAFEKDIVSITIPTATGELTILPKHADLLSLLTEGVITIRTEKEEEYMSIGGGYMETDGKIIQILVSRAFGQDEINEEMTKRALESAQKVLDEVEDKSERTEALRTLRRSMVDMKLLSKMRRKAKH